MKLAYPSSTVNVPWLIRPIERHTTQTDMTLLVHDNRPPHTINWWHTLLQNDWLKQKISKVTQNFSQVKKIRGSYSEHKIEGTIVKWLHKNSLWRQNTKTYTNEIVYNWISYLPTRQQDRFCLQNCIYNFLARSHKYWEKNKQSFKINIGSHRN